MRETLVDGVDAGFNHVGRRIKIRFADFQMDNAPALGFQRARFGQRLECGFRAQAGHTFGQPQSCRGDHCAHVYILLFLMNYSLTACSWLCDRNTCATVYVTRLFGSWKLRTCKSPSSPSASICPPNTISTAAEISIGPCWPITLKCQISLDTAQLAMREGIRRITKLSTRSLRQPLNRS